jgi:type II secretory ATPase GspE/PulE/Tfp pilus assembly ATPase PilB-like protein
MKTEAPPRPTLSRRLDELIRTPVEIDESQHTRSLIDALLQDAVRGNVSDIHLDPLRDGYELRFRIDGALMDIRHLEPSDGQHIVRAFKSHAGLDPGFSLVPQDGRVEFQVGDRSVFLRVATAPSVLGEKLALRLLPMNLAHLHLDQLGLSAGDYQRISRAMRDALGMILVSGPTGSGKTTTLYALVHELVSTNRCIAAVEDPVEYVIEGITQIQVNEKQGLTFAEGVRGLLRLDPDIIFMGEMRDRISAQAALNAADSGHLFLSSLHARDAAGTITSLRSFGLEDHEIAATVDLIAAQRLVRRLCPACRKQEPPTESEIAWLKDYAQPIPKLTWHAVGCAKCGQTGYLSRIGLFEVWRLGEEDADLILKHADERTLRRHIRRSGTLSLLEDNLQKVADGAASLAEIQTVGGIGFHASRSQGGANSPEQVTEHATSTTH